MSVLLFVDFRLGTPKSFSDTFKFFENLQNQKFKRWQKITDQIFVRVTTNENMGLCLYMQLINLLRTVEVSISFTLNGLHFQIDVQSHPTQQQPRQCKQR